MDIDKVKIKYILGSFTSEPNYPSPEDIIYLMVKRATDKGKDVNEVTFTTTNLYKKIGVELKDNIEKSINILLNDGVIDKTRDNSESITYKIKENPYL